MSVPICLPMSFKAIFTPAAMSSTVWLGGLSPYGVSVYLSPIQTSELGFAVSITSSTGSKLEVTLAFRPFPLKPLFLLND